MIPNSFIANRYTLDRVMKVERKKFRSWRRPPSAAPFNYGWLPILLSGTVRQAGKKKRKHNEASSRHEGGRPNGRGGVCRRRVWVS